MYTAKVRIWDLFVVGYGRSGPNHQHVSASAVAMSRSPKKAVRRATMLAWREFDKKTPRSYYNNIGEPPSVTLYKDGVVISDTDFPRL
jgi:hypothetical protein